jgi:hypothetical protein
LLHRDWLLLNIGAVKSCLAPTQHKGESEQDLAA